MRSTSILCHKLINNHFLILLKCCVLPLSKQQIMKVRRSNCFQYFLISIMWISLVSLQTLQSQIDCTYSNPTNCQSNSNLTGKIWQLTTAWTCTPSTMAPPGSSGWISQNASCIKIITNHKIKIDASVIDLTATNVEVWIFGSLQLDNVAEFKLNSNSKIYLYGTLLNGTGSKNQHKITIGTWQTDGNSFATYNANAPLLLTQSGAQSLPISLTRFTVEQLNNTAELAWTTESESNNNLFVIEKSFDTKQWIRIGEINGAGTSNSINHYQFIDKNPMNGIQYYRLKQEDYSGSGSYSPMVTLDFNNGKKQTTVWVDQTLRQLHIATDGLEQNIQSIKIFNSDGKLINLLNEENSVIDLPNANNQMYIIRLDYEDGHIQQSRIQVF